MSGPGADTVPGGEMAMQADEHAAEHESPPYIKVWAMLFALTMGEVFYAFLDIPRFWLAFGLIAMALWKAILVALYYMHLRFEPKRLWVMVVAPLPLAVILVVVVMMEF